MEDPAARWHTSYGPPGDCATAATVLHASASGRWVPLAELYLLPAAADFAASLAARHPDDVIEEVDGYYDPDTLAAVPLSSGGWSAPPDTAAVRDLAALYGASPADDPAPPPSAPSSAPPGVSDEWAWLAPGRRGGAGGTWRVADAEAALANAPSACPLAARPPVADARRATDAALPPPPPPPRRRLGATVTLRSKREVEAGRPGILLKPGLSPRDAVRKDCAAAKAVPALAVALWPRGGAAGSVVLRVENPSVVHEAVVTFLGGAPADLDALDRCLRHPPDRCGALRLAAVAAGFGEDGDDAAPPLRVALGVRDEDEDAANAARGRRPFAPAAAEAAAGGGPAAVLHAERNVAWVRLPVGAAAAAAAAAGVAEDAACASLLLSVRVEAGTMGLELPTLVAYPLGDAAAAAAQAAPDVERADLEKAAAGRTIAVLRAHISALGGPDPPPRSLKRQIVGLFVDAAVARHEGDVAGALDWLVEQ